MTAPQQSPGQAEADKLILAMIRKNPPAYARALTSTVKEPAILRTLRGRIQTEPQILVAQILLEELQPLISRRDNFDFCNPFHNATDAEEQTKVFRAMASGAGETAFDLPATSLDDFLVGIFNDIATQVKGISFDEQDFFHCHIVPNEANRDIVIVFHAKEFPGDIFSNDTVAMYKKWNLNTPNAGAFSVNDKVMDERNFIWTLNTHTVYLLSDPNRSGNNADPGFAKLIIPKDQGAATQLNLAAGTVFESHFGRELLAASFFPNHLYSERLFFTPVGEWGAVLQLKFEFPAASLQEIEEIFQRLQSSQAGARKELEAKHGSGSVCVIS